MASEKWFDIRFGQEVKERRERRNLTQEELARRLSGRGVNLHVSSLAKIEAGTRSVRINEAVGFAEEFEVSVDTLVGRGEPDDTTLTFALVNVMGCLDDVQARIGHARGSVTDMGELLDDIANRFDVPAVEDVRRSVLKFDRRLDTAQTEVSAIVAMVVNAMGADEDRAPSSKPRRKPK